jgi:hypothetical protein
MIRDQVGALTEISSPSSISCPARRTAPGGADAGPIGSLIGRTR